MPFYEFDVLVPRRTPATAPAQLRARMTVGLIAEVHVQIPSGVAGQVHTRARRSDVQVMPANPGGTIKGDGIVVSWADRYLLDDEPLELILEAWSPNARFDHTVTWRFQLVPLAELARQEPESPLLRRIAQFLGVRG